MTDLMRQIDKEVKEDRELARLVGQEELILGVTELILEKMEQKGLSKSQLAGLLNTDKSHITQLLRGSRNMTLRTVSDIFFSLGCKVVLDTFVEGEAANGFVLTKSMTFVNGGRATDWRPRIQDNCPHTESADVTMAA